jgi:hypothetical protein
MPTQWQTFPVEFKGGLISNMSPLQQGINAVGSAILLQNFEPAKSGGYKKVLGYSKYIDATLPGTGPVLGVKVANPDKVIAVRRNNTNLSQYYINVATSWVSLGTATLLGGKVRGASFNFNGTHKLIFVDGANKPAVFNDDTDTLSFLTVPSDVDGGSQVVVYKNHVFIAKGTLLSFSAPFSESDWTVANGAGVVNIGHEITGLIVFRDQLIIFSRNKIQRLVGSSVSDFQLLPITDNIGCLFPDTVQEVGGDVMFLAPDGIRLLGATERIGDFGLEVASEPISRDALKFISSSSSFSSLVLREKAQYRIFSYIESVRDKDADGLLATKFSDQGASSVSWATLKGFKVFCSDGRYIPGREVTVFANEDGYVYRLESQASFDGENIPCIYQSPFMPITDPQKRKTLYKMALYTDTTGSFAVDVNILFDIYAIDNYNNTVRPNTIKLQSSSAGVSIYGAVTSVYGSSTYGAELDKVYDTPLIGSGKTFSLRIEDNSTNPPFSLDTAIFEFREQDRQ